MGVPQLFLENLLTQSIPGWLLSQAVPAAAGHRISLLQPPGQLSTLTSMSRPPERLHCSLQLAALLSPACDWMGWCWPLWSPKTPPQALGQRVTGLLEVSVGLAPTLGSPALFLGTLLCLSWLAYSLLPTGYRDSSTLWPKLFFLGVVKNLFISTVSQVALWPCSKCHYLQTVSSHISAIDWSGQTYPFLCQDFCSRCSCFLTMSCLLQAGRRDGFSRMNVQALSSPSPNPDLTLSYHWGLSYHPPLCSSKWKNKDFKGRKPGMKVSFFRFALRQVMLVIFKMDIRRYTYMYTFLIYFVTLERSDGRMFMGTLCRLESTV